MLRVRFCYAIFFLLLFCFVDFTLFLCTRFACVALFAVTYLPTFLFSVDLSFVHLIAISVGSKITFVSSCFQDPLNLAIRVAFIFFLNCTLFFVSNSVFLFFSEVVVVLSLYVCGFVVRPPERHILLFKPVYCHCT